MPNTTYGLARGFTLVFAVNLPGQGNTTLPSPPSPPLPSSPQRLKINFRCKVPGADDANLVNLDSYDAAFWCVVPACTAWL